MNRFEFNFRRIFGPDTRITEREPRIQKEIDRENQVPALPREGAIPRTLKEAVNVDGSLKQTL